jgi:hypothetical protein
MKKILIVSQYFYPENFRINDIATQLVKRGFDVTVLTGLPNYPNGKYFKGFNFFKIHKLTNLNGVNIIRLPILARGKNRVSLALNYFSFWFLGSLFSIFTFKKFDMVFTYGVSPILQGSIAIIYAKRFKVKSFLYLMDFWPYSIEAVDGIKNKSILKLLGLLSKNIYLRSDKILISSLGYESDLIKLGIEKSRIYYWPQYHEKYYEPLGPNFSLTKELSSDKFNFTFTGNIGFAQGIENFLFFVIEYRANLSRLNCKFNFIGDGRAKKKLKEFVKSNNLSELICFIDAVDSKKIPQYLANSKIALLIIKENQFMNKVLPAKVSTYVGCKIPILTISRPPLSTFIEFYNYGTSSHSYKSNKIMNVIEDVIQNYKHLLLRVHSSYDQFKQDDLMNELISIF